jgi:glycosyltransferase involved in cell wall biosynthesis
MTAQIAVVVPAHNEGPNLEACLNSLASQAVPIRIMVSDNGSTDGTPEILERLRSLFEFDARRVEGLGPSEHFASCGRWALETGREPFAALLAADDRWGAGFAESAMGVLEADDTLGMAFPTCALVGDGETRVLMPPDFSSGSRVTRQVKAILLPDGGRLANHVYGLFRRDAFRDLIESWARGGEAYGSDYATVVHTLAKHRSGPAPGAVVHRSLREGQDLLFFTRLGIGHEGDEPPTHLRAAGLYVKYNLVSDLALSRALSRVYGRPPALTATVVTPLRAAHWLGQVPRLVSARVRGAANRTRK